MSYKWHESCSPGWKQQDNTFEFYLTKGIAGNCPGDDTPKQGTYEFKERQERKKMYLYSKMKYKTREELLEEPRENLTVHERVAQSTLKENPDMTLEEAIELLEMIP